MQNDHYEYLTSLDTDTERYSLVHGSGQGWSARMEILMADGSWHKAWYSETFPNQRGAREAIAQAFGI
jgi:hypothetical protein